MLARIKRIPAGVRKRIIHDANNRRVTSISTEVEKHSSVDDIAPVIIFNASTRLAGLSLNAGFSLISGWSLRLAGVPVVNFVCQAGMSHCMLGSVLGKPDDPPPCSTCIKQSQHLFSHSETRWFNYSPNAELAEKIDSLTVEALSSVIFEEIPFGELVLPAIRWVLRRYHLMDNDQTRYLFREYILSAENVARHFLQLISEKAPQSVVVFNGMSFPEATVRWLALQKNIPVITHEVGLLPLSAYFTFGHATEYPIDILDSFNLNEKQNQKLDDYLAQRFQGDFQMAGVRFWPSMQPLGQDFLDKAVKFDQIVPIFTNVIFDTSQSHANVLFENMFAWLDEISELISANPTTLFVIRAHPDEMRPGKASRESVAGWVKNKGLNSSPNVYFVDADQHINSYQLIQRSKFVLIYNSTIGMEAILLGTPVICAGRSRFTRLPTVYFPQSKPAYLELVNSFLKASQIPLPQAFKDNVRRFLYTQLFRVSLPFDQFLEEDMVWDGYVRLTNFPWQALLPKNSQTMNTVVEAVINKQPFELNL